MTHEATEATSPLAKHEARRASERRNQWQDALGHLDVTYHAGRGSRSGTFATFPAPATPHLYIAGDIATPACFVVSGDYTTSLSPDLIADYEVDIAVESVPGKYGEVGRLTLWRGPTRDLKAGVSAAFQAYEARAGLTARLEELEASQAPAIQAGALVGFAHGDRVVALNIAPSGGLMAVLAPSGGLTFVGFGAYGGKHGRRVSMNLTAKEFDALIRAHADYQHYRAERGSIVAALDMEHED